MSVSDQELELLEAYIDGELSEMEAEALHARLATEPELVATLDGLRGEQALRTRVFDALEPDDATVERLLSSVRKQLTKEIVWGERLRIMRYIGAAAACVLFSFYAGWMGRSHFGTQTPGPALPESAMVQSTGSVASNGSIDFGANGGAGSLLGNARPGGYQVALTDNLGHVVAVQRFDTLQQAREFRDDVSRWQKQQQQMPGIETVSFKDQF